MDLEQRVKVLEQEVEILKNQIQVTLLDIQEQLLTNAYPSLRAEDGAVQTRPAVLPAQPEPVAEKTIQPAVLRKVSLNAASADEPDEESEVTPPARPQRQVRAQAPDEPYETPVVRRVSFNAVPAADEPDEEPEVTPPARPQRQVRAQAPEQSYEAPVARRVSPARAGSPASRESADLTELEEWVRTTVEQLGVRRTMELIQATTEQDQITAEARDMLLQLVSAQKRNGASSRAMPAVQPQPEQDNGEEASQKLILKLIAGVQNAGAGIGRKKKNG